MTQNLDLDLTAGVALTSDTTDLNTKTSWTPNYTTQTVNNINWARTEYGTRWDGTYNLLDTVTYSYDLGNLCRNGFISAEGEEWSVDNHDVSKNFDSCSVPNTAHVGNYYTQYTDTTNSNVYPKKEDSICPKKWQLPNSDGGGDKSYGNLLGAYGIVHDSYTNAITDFPLSFIFTGGYGVNDDKYMWPTYFDWAWYQARPLADGAPMHTILAIHYVRLYSSVHIDLRENNGFGSMGVTARCVAR